MVKPMTRIAKTFSTLMFVGLLAWGAHAALAQAPDAPPPPPPQNGDSASHHHAAPPASRPLSPLAPGEKRIAITFEGGHDTDPRDHGRPVTLIAAALNVPTDVFRQTFTHVHPAGPGSGGPTDAEARQNKAALLTGLSPYGVTNDRLNTVSNCYRYMKRNPDDLWQHRDAVAFAVARNNQIVRFDITDSGAGYTTPPKAEIENMPNTNLDVKLTFGTDLVTNGSIKSIAPTKPATP